MCINVTSTQKPKLQMRQWPMCYQWQQTQKAVDQSDVAITDIWSILPPAYFINDGEDFIWTTGQVRIIQFPHFTETESELDTGAQVNIVIQWLTQSLSNYIRLHRLPLVND